MQAGLNFAPIVIAQLVHFFGPNFYPKNKQFFLKSERHHRKFEKFWKKRRE